MQLLMFCLSDDEMCNTSFLFHFLLLVFFLNDLPAHWEMDCETWLLYQTGGWKIILLEFLWDKNKWTFDSYLGLGFVFSMFVLVFLANMSFRNYAQWL